MSTIKEEIYRRLQEEQQAPAVAPVQSAVSIDPVIENQIAGPAFEFSDDIPASETIYRQYMRNPEQDYSVDPKKAENARKLAAFTDFASLIGTGIAAAGGGKVPQIEQTATETYNNTFSKMYDHYRTAQDRYNSGLASAKMQDSRLKEQRNTERNRTMQQYSTQQAIQKQKQEYDTLQRQQEVKSQKEIYDHRASIEDRQRKEAFEDQKALRKIPQARIPASTAAKKTETKKKTVGKFTGGSPSAKLGR